MVMEDCLLESHSNDHSKHLPLVSQYSFLLLDFELMFILILRTKGQMFIICLFFAGKFIIACPRTSDQVQTLFPASSLSIHSFLLFQF